MNLRLSFFVVPYAAFALGAYFARFMPDWFVAILVVSSCLFSSTLLGMHIGARVALRNNPNHILPDPS